MPNKSVKNTISSSRVATFWFMGGPNRKKREHQRKTNKRGYHPFVADGAPVANGSPAASGDHY